MASLLDDKVRARLRCGDGAASSSCHPFLLFYYEDDGEDDDDGYAEEEGSAAAADGECNDDNMFHIPSAAIVRDLLVAHRADRFRAELLNHVTEAVAANSLTGPSDGSGLRRAVARSLREAGYNAGLCRSRWGAGAGGAVGGSHEYVDVVGSSARYVVEVEFAAGLVIARATAEYAGVVAELPRVAVMRAEELRRVLRVVAEAGRRSLRSRDMHVAPWRKLEYLCAKWLGPYTRTILLPPPPPPPTSARTR